MPTYEYRCGECSFEFEQFQSITAQPLRKCPECSKLKLKRLIGTGAGVLFKGGGFYETDYRSESYKKAAEAEKKSAGGDSGGKKSESGEKGGASAKPDAKTDTRTDTRPDTKSRGRGASGPTPKKSSGSD